ncbi:MAG: hypothetical protein AAFO91_17165, partial [Bacteroidota bacterium]
MLRRLIPAFLLTLGLLACQPTDTTTQAQRKGPQDLYPVLFDAVQMAGLFPDSKTFVDYIPKRSPQELETAYQAQKDSSNFDLRAFVEANF